MYSFLFFKKIITLFLETLILYIWRTWRKYMREENTMWIYCRRMWVVSWYGFAWTIKHSIERSILSCCECDLRRRARSCRDRNRSPTHDPRGCTGQLITSSSTQLSQVGEIGQADQQHEGVHRSFCSRLCRSRSESAWNYQQHFRHESKLLPSRKTSKNLKLFQRSPNAIWIRDI